MAHVNNFDQFIPVIQSIKTSNPLAEPEVRRLLELNQEGGLETVYAPFDHIAEHARLVIVGITPGYAQATNALNAAKSQLAQGGSPREASRAAKLTASFSGSSTRNNLVRMMDEIGLNKIFGIRSTSELFTEKGEYVHFTSALRYPVFVNGSNYNGTPDMLKTTVLRRMIETCLAEEANLLGHAVWIPLGPKPAAALGHLVKLGILHADKILDGMPHPSGANAERVAAFLGTKSADQFSSKTNPGKIAAAKTALARKVARLAAKGEAA